MSKDKKSKKAKKLVEVAQQGTFTPAGEAGMTPERLEFLTRKHDAEVAAQWAHHRQIDDPSNIAADLIVDAAEGFHPFHSTYGNRILCTVMVVRDGETDECGLLASNLVHDVRPVELVIEGPAPVEGENQNTFIDGLIADMPVIAATLNNAGRQLELALGLEPAVDPVLMNGNGQALIHYLDPVTGKEKVKGYTRVTTYIDGLDDKTVLTKWKMRTLLAGAAVELTDLEENHPVNFDTSINVVARATKRLDAAIADIDRRESVEGELLELRRQELLKEHRDLLEGIADDLMELGGAHEKANKGTDLHRLTELVDTGRPLPEDVTASDRRDVEAYQAKMAELGITTLWTEKRVVLDDIQVSGTMDRAYHVKLPGMARRTRVVGDLKTGSIAYSHGKIATQMLLYARGFGYDHAKPLERERLSLSKAHALLVHLPQGEGKCEVYVVDLELAAQGLDLAGKVREWRRTQKRAYDIKSPLAVTMGTPPPHPQE